MKAHIVQTVRAMIPLQVFFTVISILMRHLELKVKRAS